MDEAPEVHQFDFWLGDWEVFTAEGARVGTNHITSLFGGRALAESWEGAGGVSGASLNSWDPDRGVWHQTWMDSGGSTLLLDGNLRAGQMVLEGTAPAGDPALPDQRHRITWTPAENGAEVRQLWESSADDGATWTIAFDGRYRRALD